MSVADNPSKNRESNSKSGPESRAGMVRNGLVGGGVAALLSFLPLSELLGGGVAGYLERGSGRHGSAAGAVAGVVAFLPYLVVGVYLAVAPGVVLPGPELALSREFMVAAAASVALVYVVGLSVLGSLLGGFVHDER
ncbi:MAG: hypothetical protein ACI8U4_000483 [Natronomonas sp.]|jgi:hypothetical protein